MPNMFKLFSVALLVTLPTPLFAQENEEGRSLKQCRGINDAMERLACYDRFTDSIGRDIALKSARPYDPIKDFGASSEMLDQADVEKLGPEFIESKVVSASETGYGKWTLTLETGAVWTQVDTVNLVSTPKANAMAKIKRVGLGGYVATVGKGKAFKVKRVR